MRSASCESDMTLRRFGTSAFQRFKHSRERSWSTPGTLTRWRLLRPLERVLLAGCTLRRCPSHPAPAWQSAENILHLPGPLSCAAKRQSSDMPKGAPIMMKVGTTAWGASLGNSGLGWAMSSMGLSRGGAAAATTGTIGGAPSAVPNGPAAPLAAGAEASARPGMDASATSPRPPSHNETMGGQPTSRPGRVDHQPSSHRTACAACCIRGWCPPVILWLVAW